MASNGYDPPIISVDIFASCPSSNSHLVLYFETSLTYDPTLDEKSLAVFFVGSICGCIFAKLALAGQVRATLYRSLLLFLATKTIPLH